MVAVGEVIARADVPLANLPVGPSGAQVIGDRPGVRRLFDLLWRAHTLERHHVVEHHQAEVRAGWLTIDQAMRFDRRLFGVRLAPGHDALFLRPLWRLFARLGPQDVGKQGLQRLVDLEFGLDLQQELPRARLCVAENPDRDLGIAQDLLNDSGKRDDGALVMFPGPQVEEPIGRRLDLAAASVDPRMQRIEPAESVDQQKEPVAPAERPLDFTKRRRGAGKVVVDRGVFLDRPRHARSLHASDQGVDQGRQRGRSLVKSRRGHARAPSEWPAVRPRPPPGPARRRRP